MILTNKTRQGQVKGKTEVEGEKDSDRDEVMVCCDTEIKDERTLSPH